jgi:hypothetical protein
VGAALDHSRCTANKINSKTDKLGLKYSDKIYQDENSGDHSNYFKKGTLEKNKQREIQDLAQAMISSFQCNLYEPIDKYQRNI